MDITQSKLKELFNYSSETGIFTWVKRNKNIAGYLNKSTGYIRIRIYGKVYQAHRLAWLYVYGVFPELLVDHIDRNKTNNAISNLRNATHSENMLNRKSCANICGIYYRKDRMKYKAIIQIGYYDTKEQAITALSKAKDKLSMI